MTSQTNGLPRSGTLYKYIDPVGGLAFLRTALHWYRCPLEFADPLDSQADLIANTDRDGIRALALTKLKAILCRKADISFHPGDSPLSTLMAQLLTNHKTHGRICSEQEVESTYSGPISEGISALVSGGDTIREQVKQQLRQLRVLCLCDIHDSVKMWTDYASRQTGMCLGFEYVPSIDNAIGAARQVQYVDRWPPIASAEEWSDQLLSIGQIPFGKRAVEGLFMKHRSFEFEREWRVLVTSSSHPEFDDGTIRKMRVEPEELVKVILGTNMTTANRDAVRHECTARWPRASIIEQ